LTHSATGYIWFTGCKGGEWKTPEDTNTKYGTTGAPAIIVFDDKLYAVHEGFGQNSQLWWTRSTFDGKTLKWEGDNNTGVQTTGAPALAVWGDILYCVHLGARVTLAKDGKATGPPDQTLYWMSFDKKNWSENKSLGVKAAGTPTLAVYNKKLYCVYQDIGNGEFWYLVYDGKDWTKPNKTPFATFNAPTLAVYNGKLHAFHEGYQTILNTGISISSPRSHKLWYTARDDGDWNKPADTDTKFGVSDPPALAVVGDKLYCVHQGTDSNGELWWFSVDHDKDGEKLSEDQKIEGQTTASAPALDRNGPIWQTIRQRNARRGTNYDIAFFNAEYPPRDPRDPRTTPASGSTNGYAVVYDQNIVTRVTDPVLFEPQNFRQGLNQARPPLEIQFRLNGVGTNFFFYTWHAEASLAQDNVRDFYRTVDHNANWILAGDLNVQRNGLQAAVDQARDLEEDLPELNDNQELHHYDTSLDYIVTNQQAGNFIRDDDSARMRRFWMQLLSDAVHYALFSNIYSGGKSK
jgi:hypothetical protein